MIKYNPDMPFYLDRSLARARRKLAELELREQIYNIEQKLTALKACEKWYPECVGEATTSPDADGGGQSLQPPSPADRRLLSLEPAK